MSKHWTLQLLGCRPVVLPVVGHQGLWWSMSSLAYSEGVSYSHCCTLIRDNFCMLGQSHPASCLQYRVNFAVHTSGALSKSSIYICKAYCHRDLFDVMKMWSRNLWMSLVDHGQMFKTKIMFFEVLKSEQFLVQWSVRPVAAVRKVWHVSTVVKRTGNISWAGHVSFIWIIHSCIPPCVTEPHIEICLCWSNSQEGKAKSGVEADCCDGYS